MPLESATYLNNLVASNPASTDTVSQADDHIRLIKQVLKSTFPNINAPVTATPAQLNSAVPAGFIGMWSGSLATIPAGWGLCDGAGGRPDLRNRFIVGAGLGYAVAATGGADVVILTETNLPSHSHTTSASGATGDVNLSHNHTFSGSSGTAGAHSHTVRLPTNTGFGAAAQTTESGIARDPTDYFNYTTSNHDGHNHSISGSIGNALGNHAHSVTVSVTVNSTGSGAAHENRPPYYALAFIIKL
jgi:microcystin-dependent protein